MHSFRYPSCPPRPSLAQAGLSHLARDVELVRAFSSLPPLCTIFHICFHLSACIPFLAPEYLHKPLNVLDEWCTFALVIAHPLDIDPMSPHSYNPSLHVGHHRTLVLRVVLPLVSTQLLERCNCMQMESTS